MARRAVEPTPEFRRVAALPRREWSDKEAAELAELLTRELRTPFGKFNLRPIQGLMLAEAVDVGGGFFACSVGKGKTLPSFLIPTLLQAQRPLLLVQANLLEKTQRDLAYWAYHFRVHPRIKVMSYERLSTVSGADALEDYKPDHIGADEGHRLKNRKSARGRRFLRYMEAHQDTKLSVFSGSVTRKSLRDYWHLLCLALPKTAPMPYILSQLETWADALDPDVDDRVRLAPGCLLDFTAANDDAEGFGADELQQAWSGYRRRLADTRGVVITPENEIPSSLNLIERPLEAPRSVNQALADLRGTWETPNGDELTEAVAVWRHARELASGFFYKWQPRPPPEWMAARKAWNKFVRTILGHNRPGLDSPLQVARHYSEMPLYRAWQHVRPLYDPSKHQRAEWIDDFLIRDAASWLAEGPGIAWVEHNAVGQRLAVLTGLPYYGGGPEASARILDAKGPIIASIAAHGTGKNLQHYARNLILSLPPSADTLEQLLGRTHREGQEADAVDVSLYLHAEEIRQGFVKALREAHYIEKSTGMPQKLLAATRTFDLDA